MFRSPRISGNFNKSSALRPHNDPELPNDLEVSADAD